jgi:hypothetical protein
MLISAQNRDILFYDMHGYLIKRVCNVLDARTPDHHGFDLIANKLIVTNRNGSLCIFE